MSRRSCNVCRRENVRECVYATCLPPQHGAARYGAALCYVVPSGRVGTDTHTSVLVQVCVCMHTDCVRARSGAVRCGAVQCGAVQCGEV